MLPNDKTQDVSENKNPDTSSETEKTEPQEHMIPKSRLDEEITKRRSFETQVAELLKKVTKGSEAEAQLQKMQADLELSNKRASFYEEAQQYECKNSKAAFAYATSQDLFTKSGRPDWKTIQSEVPELFGKASSPVKKSAGSGTEREPVTSESMSDWIRKEAGHTP